jgi:putative nucleotidyltransferase with HDIG domain
VLTGTAIILHSFSQIDLKAIDWGGFAAFTILTVISELLPVRLSNEALVSVGFSITFASIIIFGPSTAVLIVLLGNCLSSAVNYKHMSTSQFLFNTNMFVIMAGAAGHIYVMAGGVPDSVNVFHLCSDIIPILICVVTDFILNVVFIATLLSLTEHDTFKHIWLLNLKWILPSYLALVPLGLLLALSYTSAGIPGVIMFFIPLMVARHSFKLYMNMRGVYLETVQSLAAAIEAKDIYTRGHSERVARYAVVIAKELNLPQDQIETIQYAALLHDIGKIGIGENILNKPDKLSESEYTRIREHPVMGASIVERVNFLSEISELILYHHERYDGSGYPKGLKGDEIPIGASILAVSDVYDALSSDRPYRKAWFKVDTIGWLEDMSGVEFDPKVVNALISAYKKGLL